MSGLYLLLNQLLGFVWVEGEQSERGKMFSYQEFGKRKEFKQIEIQGEKKNIKREY